MVFMSVSSLLVAIWDIPISSFKALLIMLTFWVFQNMEIINKIVRGTLFHLISVSLLLTIISFFITGKTMTFYILFELSLIPTLFMVFFFGYQPEKIQASMYLLMYTVLSSLPLLLLFISSSSYLIYFGTGSGFWLCLVLTMGFMVKTPMYLVHIWLPKAHVEAPVAGSMVLAGVLLKLGSYGLIVFCPLIKSSVLLIYLSLSILGSLLCSMICVRQWDLKSLIAYSSVVHMGVVTVGVVSGLELGYVCSIMMVVAHGVCSPVMFAMAYLVYNSSHTRTISSNKGTLGTPMMSFFLFLTLAINMGVPPSLNLWSEVVMFISILSIMTYSWAFLIATAFLGAVYNLFMYVSMSQSKESDSMKVDYIYWPMVSSSYLAFSMFFMVGWFFYA